MVVDYKSRKRGNQCVKMHSDSIRTIRVRLK